MRSVGIPGVGAVGVAILLAGLIVTSPTAAVAQDDPHAGTWVLNVGKSKFSPGPSPKEQTVVWSVDGEGYKAAPKPADDDGTPNPAEYIVSFDGTDHPATGFEAVTGKRVDDRTLELTFKKAGAVVQTRTLVLSNYGKTRTTTITGVNSQGAPIKSVLVFEKK